MVLQWIPNPGKWVDRARELERALGSAEKFVAENEQQTVIIQRAVCAQPAISARGSADP